MKPGDRIQWTYKHHLNRRSYVNITKTGTFVRNVNSLFSDTACMVHFDGNKNLSRVDLKSLTHNPQP